MVRVSSPATLRPWSELTAKMVMGVVPGLVRITWFLDPESGLCWVRAASGPFFGEQFIPTQSGFKMGFLSMG